MILVEAIRLRWWMIWWSAVILLIGIAIAIAAEKTGLVVNGTRVNDVAVPLLAIAPIAMFLSMIFATSAGLSLNREAQTLALSWTKPVPRASIALRIVAVDLVALLATYVFSWLVVLGVLGAAGAAPQYTPEVPVMVVVSLGVAVMWYALCEAITAALPAGGRGAVGFMWPVALVLSGMFNVGGVFGAIVLALNVINPLAYLNHITRHDESLAIAGYWQAPLEERAFAVWALSAIMIAIAVALWTRREA